MSILPFRNLYRPEPEGIQNPGQNVSCLSYAEALEGVSARRISRTIPKTHKKAKSRKTKKVWGLGGLSSKGPQIKIRSQKRIEEEAKKEGKAYTAAQTAWENEMRFCTSEKGGKGAPQTDEKELRKGLKR